MCEIDQLVSSLSRRDRGEGTEVEEEKRRTRGGLIERWRDRKSERKDQASLKTIDFFCRYWLLAPEYFRERQRGKERKCQS